MILSISLLLFVIPMIRLGMTDYIELNICGFVGAVQPWR